MRFLGKLSRKKDHSWARLWRYEADNCNQCVKGISLENILRETKETYSQTQGVKKSKQRDFLKTKKKMFVETRYTAHYWRKKLNLKRAFT